MTLTNFQIQFQQGIKGKSLGYDTDFFGEFITTPKLNPSESEFLNRFSKVRRGIRNHHLDGKYYIEDPNDKDDESFVSNVNFPNGQPGYWCQWVSNSNGNIEWDKVEKFYEPAEWILYLIEHLFKENAYMSILAPSKYQYFAFQPHILNGEIVAKGEEFGHIWKIEVKDNQVYEFDGRLSADDKEIYGKKNKTNLNPEEQTELESKFWLYFNDFTKVVWFNSQELIYSPTEEEKIALEFLKLNDCLKPNNKTNKLII